MNKTGDTKKAETAVRTDKYPHSDNDWENFDVLHINRLPSAATFMAYTTKESSEERQESIGIFSVVERYLEVSVCSPFGPAPDGLL